MIIKQPKSWLLPIVEMVKPPPATTVSDWADMYRVLTSHTTPEPGNWKTMRTPYLRQIMNDFSDIDVEHVVIMKATQLGFTEALLNILAYIIDYEPSPTLIVYPTIELARYVSKNRIQVMIETCEKLRQKIPSNPDDYTTLEIRFRDMVLSIIGANSPAQLASRPVRFLIRDEIDKFAKQAGTEADPIALSEERTKNFWNRKIFDVSTPTTESGNIYRQFLSCDAVYEYYVPCLHCGYYQTLKFENIKFSDDDDMTIVKNSAIYECEKCKGTLGDKEKIRMIQSGEWRGHKTTIARKKGYKIPSWYSPWITWGDCVMKFLQAKEFPELLMNFRNSWEADVWKQVYTSKTTEELKRNIVSVQEFECPQDTLAITMGIDVGQGGAWYVIVAWQGDMSCHIVHYGFISLPAQNSWIELAKLLHEARFRVTGRDAYLSVWRAGIDIGGGRYQDEDETMTEKTYDFIYKYGGGKLRACKGASGQYLPKRVKTMTQSYTKSKAYQRGIEVLTIDTAQFKDAIYYRLNLAENEAGRMTFHANAKEDIFKHITAEEKRKDKDGTAYWVKVRRDNHLLDCLVIAYALADIEYQGGIKMVQQLKISTQPIIIKKRSDWLK